MPPPHQARPWNVQPQGLGWDPAVLDTASVESPEGRRGSKEKIKTHTDRKGQHRNLGVGKPSAPGDKSEDMCRVC